MLAPDRAARILRDEIASWAGFADALRGADRQAFKEMMNEAYPYVYAIANSEKTLVFEALFMTLLLVQHKKIQWLHSELRRLQTKLGGAPQNG